MLIFLDVYSTNIKFLKKDIVAIILKNLNTIITDDHQYNILLFEHIFGYSLFRDILIMDRHLEEYKQRIITSGYDPRNVLIDIVNMRVASTRTSYPVSRKTPSFMAEI